ncbi:glyoxylase-like metal-dependent hydrolase (beta-lactamase superfamily II) [Chitinophaga skermanii]|uniref:Glyoxylase-like metal-dependent hydrolase (Beta-lactamase superfamily II) n=1 Tax=Chitinophaga skermanii TaxID=331697 RepID=A0A327QIZ7_9BACT|nr:MBL fold metallo-hydrolase [Chitinophaga skermanii]RAJ03965.1 glyoxylase-like metal-dependent hydrolase (beta-lactamase superfamily II) [Chitinophaga skermanii]
MIEIQHFTFSPFQENTYLLINEENKCIVIDPGCYFDYERTELLQFIATRKLEVEMLWNTHCHLDHVFGNHLICNTFNVLPVFHPLEQVIFDRQTQTGLTYGLPFPASPQAVEFFHDEQIIKWGQNEIKVILTPGHSPGSVSFYCEKQAFLISGDVLFYESVGRTDFQGCNHADLMDSIKNKLFRLPGQVKVYPGHGPSTTIQHEIEHNPFIS